MIRKYYFYPLIAKIILISLLLVSSMDFAMADIHPYNDFQRTVWMAVRDSLNNYAMFIPEDREHPWLAFSAKPGSYTIKLHRSNEIPKQAILDVIKICMDFHDQRGQKERFRIVMYIESKEEWRNSLFLGIGSLTFIKPHFELTIGRAVK